MSLVAFPTLDKSHKNKDEMMVTNEYSKWKYKHDNY